MWRAVDGAAEERARILAFVRGMAHAGEWAQYIADCIEERCPTPTQEAPMPTTDRPAAPLIPATAELLEGWRWAPTWKRPPSAPGVVGARAGVSVVAPSGGHQCLSQPGPCSTVGWRGPVVWHQYADGELVDWHELVVGEVDGVPWLHWPDGGQTLAGALGERGVQLLLDLRRPEVARHVREHLAARHGLDEVEHGVRFVPWSEGVYLLEAGSDLPFAADADWNDGGGSLVHVPALASLPEEHCDAWALWECWRAMEVDRG